MSLTQTTTHEADIITRLIEQFKGKVDIEAFLQILGVQIQDLENALFEILNETSIDTAVGEQLDNIGRILNEPRNDRTDADYRIALRAIVQQNLSEGTPEDLINIALAIIGGGNSITYDESPIAHFDLEVDDPIPAATGDEIARVIQTSKPAGVRGITYWQIATGVDYFGFSTDPDALGFTAGDFATAVDEQA